MFGTQIAWVITDQEYPKYPAKESTLSKLSEDLELRTILFGDWLVRRGLISRAQLFEALNYSYLWGLRIGDALVELQVIDRDRVEEEAQVRSTFLSFAAPA